MKTGIVLRKLLLGTAAAGGLLTASVPAGAADLSVAPAPAPAPYVAPVPVFSWTGFYIGGNAGAAWRSSDNWWNSWWGLPGFAFPDGTWGCGASWACNNGNAVFTGGGQAGFNWQTGQFVLGVEGDVNYIGRRTDNASNWGAGGTAFTFNGTPYSVSGTWGDDNNWFATARARAGVAFDRLLVYGTGGVAFQGSGSGNSLTLTNLATGGAVTYTGDNANTVGWAAGVGLDYAVTDTISLGVEYLHVDFGSRNLVDPVASIASGTPSFASVRDSDDLVRARLNFKFSGF